MIPCFGGVRGHLCAVCELVEENINTWVFCIAFLKYQAGMKYGNPTRALAQVGTGFSSRPCGSREHLNNQMRGGEDLLSRAHIWRKHLFIYFEKHHISPALFHQGREGGKTRNKVRITYYPVPFAIGSGSQAFAAYINKAFSQI